MRPTTTPLPPDPFWLDFTGFVPIAPSEAWPDFTGYVPSAETETPGPGDGEPVDR